MEPWIEGLWKALHEVMDKQGTPDSNGCLENGHLEMNGERNEDNGNGRMIGENAESGTTQNGSLHIGQADQAQPKTGEQSSTGNNTSAMSGKDVNGSDLPDHPGNCNNIAQTLPKNYLTVNQFWSIYRSGGINRWEGRGTHCGITYPFSTSPQWKWTHPTCTASSFFESVICPQWNNSKYKITMHTTGNTLNVLNTFCITNVLC